MATPLLHTRLARRRGGGGPRLLAREPDWIQLDHVRVRTLDGQGVVFSEGLVPVGDDHHTVRVATWERWFGNEKAVAIAQTDSGNLLLELLSGELAHRHPRLQEDDKPIRDGIGIICVEQEAHDRHARAALPGLLVQPRALPPDDGGSRLDRPVADGQAQL